MILFIIIIVRARETIGFKFKVFKVIVELNFLDCGPSSISYNRSHLDGGLMLNSLIINISIKY